MSLQEDDDDTTIVTHREPLNLPRGTVRTSLVFMILLPFWILLGVGAPGEALGPIPLFLYFLLFLVFVFYASHGSSIGIKDSANPHSFWVPWRLFFPIVFFLITAALIGWGLYRDPQDLAHRLTPNTDLVVKQWPWLLGAMVLGFGLGWATSHVLDMLGLGQSAIYQDIQASVSIGAMLLLGVVTIIHVFINPGLQLPIEPTLLEAILTAVVAWYFGARSPTVPPTLYRKA